MKNYTIVLADDHAMMREGIKNMIDAVDGLKVTGEAGNGLTLLKLLKRSTPDMVILDISMPGLQGIEAAREIRSCHPDIQVLILSMHKREEFLAMALGVGAKGYLLKEDTSRELLKAIDRIRNGQTYLSRKMADAFPSTVASIGQGAPKVPAKALTPRERQVLQLIAEGHSDKQISDQLCISVRTVQCHHANIRSKLNLKKTADLVRYAISEGYIAGNS